MDSKFTWVPLYEELAQALLRYKEDRTELVEWIYEDLSKVTRADGQSLVAYLKQKDGSRIFDIDPFSVFAIFNRSTSWDNRTELLTHFKKKFRLTSTIPSDFNGIPTVDARRSFFFSWKSDNNKVIHDLWQLFEKVISNHDISEAFDQVLENGMPKYSLTMCLFWICPEKYLALDSRNRSYLNSFGFPNEFSKFNYHDYSDLLTQVQKKINIGDIPCSSFLDISFRAWTEAASTNYIPQLKYKEYIDLLKEAHNLVLTGAPGTGKTHMAQAIAEEMGAVTKFVQFHPSYDYTDFVEGLRPIEKGDGQLGFERKDGVFKEFCREAIKNLIDSEKSIESLTKEMSWQEKLDRFVEDSIEEGTKFKTVNGSEFIISEIKNHSIVIHNEQNEKTTQVAVNADEILELLTNEVPLNIVRDIRNYFSRKFGTQPDSYAFVIAKAIRAMRQKMPVVEANKIDRKPFVFIIDEINRGEASKIFGELFYAIDPGYRGKNGHLVQTQYQNLVPETDMFAKGFYVPENVYILATMNDIDRSVESMDFAMHRRFTWKEVTPTDTEAMLDTLPCANEAKATMNRLNNVIAETEGLGAAYMIGPSYFLKLGENGGDFLKLWKMNIEPLLKEYLRGFRKADEIIDRFNKSYFNTKEDTATDQVELIDED